MNVIPPVIYIIVLAALGYYDFKRNRIPNKIVYPAAVAAILLNIFFSYIPMKHIFGGGVMALGIAFILSRVAALGGGDIKFFTLIGLMFGFPWFFAVLLGGFMMGGLVSLLVLVKTWRYKSTLPVAQYREYLKWQKTPMPFGFYLAISGIAVSGWLIFIIVLG